MHVSMSFYQIIMKVSNLPAKGQLHHMLILHDGRSNMCHCCENTGCSQSPAHFIRTHFIGVLILQASQPKISWFLPVFTIPPCACNIWIFFLATTRLCDIRAFIFISEAFEQHYRELRSTVKHKERQVAPCLPQGWITMEIAPLGWYSHLV